MFKNEASLFKNKSPCITKDDSHRSRAGHSFTFLDLGFLTEIQKEAVRTGKPGNGKSRLRRKIGLKQQGVLQGTGRAVWKSPEPGQQESSGQEWEMLQGHSISKEHTQRQIFKTSQTVMVELVQVPGMKPDVANYRTHVVQCASFQLHFHE